mmetsp:Transcript_38833/g.95563  ORF Transcript_38833/g.95563 Transcript_38833/m.95563 type:complete len:283 (-) Transcript_38833:203-1051(-)
MPSILSFILRLSFSASSPMLSLAIASISSSVCATALDSFSAASSLSASCTLFSLSAVSSSCLASFATTVELASTLASSSDKSDCFSSMDLWRRASSSSHSLMVSRFACSQSSCARRCTLPDSDCTLPFMPLRRASSFVSSPSHSAFILATDPITLTRSEAHSCIDPVAIGAASHTSSSAGCSAGVHVGVPPGATAAGKSASDPPASNIVAYTGSSSMAAWLACFAFPAPFLPFLFTLLVTSRSPTSAASSGAGSLECGDTLRSDAAPDPQKRPRPAAAAPRV